MAAAGTTTGKWLERHALALAGFCLLGLVGAVVWLWETHFSFHDQDSKNIMRLEQLHRDRLRDIERRITIIETRLLYHEVNIPQSEDTPP